MTTGKRLSMRLCAACDGAVIGGDTHGPDHDLREIRERDAAYDSMAVFKGPLSSQPTARLQMAADRRMLLRMLDAELKSPS